MSFERSNHLRQRRRPTLRPHGWFRSDDLPQPESMSGGDERHRRAPAGTSLLFLLLVGVLAGIGIARVHATTQVLELGAQIAELTSEHAKLLEEKRRLAAERAYLRHPAQIQQAARDELGLVPIAPELVQQIEVIEVPGRVAEENTP